MWSFGVIVFILLVGYMPFSGSSESEQMRNIKAGKFTNKKAKWDKVSAIAFKFVESLIVVSPESRLTPQQALDHVWLRTCDDGGTHLDQSIADSLCEYSKQSQFRKACMQLMAWSLTRDERGMVRDAFLELDTSKSGRINLTQLKTVLQTKFHVSEVDAVKVFQELDSNDDQEIEYSEFLAAMMASRIKFHDALLKDTFRRFDKSGTGQVTAENLKEVLGADFDADGVMRNVDSNHDGKISYEEFMGYIKNASEDHDPSHLDFVHDIIDREHSNSLATQDQDDGSPVRLRKR